MLHLPLWLALAAGISAPPQPTPVSDANVAMACQWPTVVSFRTGEGKCSGTLVHPRVVVTAAHCIEPSAPGGIRFGEQFQPAAMIVDVERCGLDPEYARTGAPSSDIGWCVLREPVQGIPPTPLLMGCEAGLLREGEPAVIVGLGVSEEDDLFGTKRYAFTALDSDEREDGTVWVGDAEVGGCLGDSGGPAFVQAPGGSWHAIGVLTFGPACGQGPVLYRVLHDRIAWLEAETGFDLSPCHDADGRWAPDPACETVAALPLARGARWAERCAGERVPAPTCPEEAGGSETDPMETSSTDDGIAAPADEEAGCGCRAGAPRWGALLTLLTLLGLSCRRR